jgi:hypothetical protein
METPVTDFHVHGILHGKVTSLKVLDPFDVELSWELTGAATPVVGGSWVVVTRKPTEKDG